jgi:hypothetical protein
VERWWLAEAVTSANPSYRPEVHSRTRLRRKSTVNDGLVKIDVIPIQNKFRDLVSALQFRLENALGFRPPGQWVPNSRWENRRQSTRHTKINFTASSGYTFSDSFRLI